MIADFFIPFIAIAVSEIGDKSQTAALLLGTKYNMLLALLGAIAGIAAVLAAMLLLGK